MPSTPSNSNLSGQSLLPSNLVKPPQTARVLIVGLFAITVATGHLACGLESDGSHRAADSRSADAPQMLDRYRTEAVRLGVSRPLFLLIDTATGQVLQREILGNQKFQPVTDDPAPGDRLKSKIPGRFDVTVVPGRRGLGLLRLDTCVTGKDLVRPSRGATA